MHRRQEKVHCTASDPAAVFNAFFDGVTEMDADENPRHRVLVCCLGEAGVASDDWRLGIVGSREVFECSNRDRETASTTPDSMRARCCREIRPVA